MNAMPCWPAGTPSPLVFLDSGIGGLSVLAAVRHQLPSLPVLMIADNAGFPYGTKPESVVLDRLLTLAEHLIAPLQPRGIVIACNTASTLALPALREKYAFPVIGVVPALKPAAAASRKKQIGLLATPATIVRPYTRKLIDDFCQDVRVDLLGSRELVLAAEAKARGVELPDSLVADAVRPFRLLEAGCPDLIVLGCTHFPFLRDEILRELPEGVTLIDSSEAIARQVRRLLGDFPGEAADAAIHFTAEAPDLHRLTPFLRQLGIRRGSSPKQSWQIAQDA
ncbi:MAG: Glutamate racemase [Verrucomicrobiota bacterium]|jgi:glutamate racemase